MRFVKDLLKRTIMLIILISLLISFLATPSSYAKLELEEDEFYYAGTTEGSYAPSFNIFSWLLNNIGDIADWLLGIITMGFRMVFVGWTALLEKLLTWALESTTGVTADGQLVGSSTDLTGLTDSSNNLTVEAIVYNRVAGLNIDFFDLEFDPTTTGTGKKLICGKCNKPVEECLTDDKVQPVIEAGKAYVEVENNYKNQGWKILPTQAKDDLEAADANRKAAIKDVLKNSNCGCNSCDDCERYLIQLSTKEPLIIRLRKLVATWYTIIRLLAMAAMLIVLIAVGIKMALSTIASDKAVYKRMLVDWVVGVIILFSIHYFMIFCIYMNGVIVKVIEDSAQSINKVQMQQLSDSDTEITNAELEIKVYEEVRTRAYDARLINGVTGMVMYMTLVFFAFKYTLIYLKRLLTILVLTLMGPGVGVAYALQKAMTGKSRALKTWMTEYIMNVIIQIVHALMYAIFISQAMVLSLQSVAGMIIALILMNYTSKADTLFKKIFRFGGGDSLVGHTANAMDSAIQGIQATKGIVTGAKPAAKILTNTPYAKALKGIGKTALAGAVGIGAGIGTGINAIRGKNTDEKYGEAMYDAMDGEVEQRKGETEEEYNGRLQAAREKVGKNGKFQEQIALDMGKGALEEQLSKARQDLEDENNTTPMKDRKDAFIAASKRMKKYERATMPTTGKIALGHARRIFDIKNEFNVKKGAGFKNNVKAIHNGVFGTVHFDKRSWKFTRDKDAVFNQFSSENLFGMTAEDKKMFKQHVLTPIRNGLGGMVGVFVGMGTIVANPKLGMGLLAAGTVTTAKTFKKPTNINSYKGTYTFSRFGISTMNTIKNSAIAQARRERRGIIADRLQKTNPTFTQRLKDGDIKAITLGVVTTAIIPGALPAYLALHPVQTVKGVTNATLGTIIHPKRNFSNVKKYGGKVWKSAKQTGPQIKYSVTHPLKTAKKAAKGVGNVAKSGAYATLNAGEAVVKAPKRAVRGFINNTVFAEHEEAMNRYNALEEEKRIKEFKKETDKLISIQAAEEALYIVKKSEEEILIEAYKEAGFHYDPKTGVITFLSENSETNSTNKTKKTAVIDSSEIKDEIGERKIRTSEVDLIDKEIDNIIAELSSGKEIDVTDKKVQNDIKKILDERLINAHVLKNGETAEKLFKRGKSGLNHAIKEKAKKSNTQIVKANKSLEAVLSKEDAEIVKNAVTERIKEQNGKDKVEIPVEDIVALINPSQDGSSPVNKSDGTRRANKNVDGSIQVSNEEKSSAISKFIQSVTPTTSSTASSEKPAASVVKNARIDAERKANDRIKKLQQVMSMAMEIDPPETETGTDGKTTESVVKQLLSGSTSLKDGSKEVSLSESEAASATKMVKKLLEIKEANREAVQELDLKKGTKGYAKVKKDKSKLAIEILELEKEKLDTQNGTVKRRNAETGEYLTPEEAKIKIKADIEEKSKKLKETKQLEPLVGPIYDINDLIKNQMGRR